jgi:2-polyprenyl-3-methyl-5-hydroxy-6-metoxy-1,4-benzoquinol methylase
MPMKREPLEHEPGWQGGARGRVFRHVGTEGGDVAARERFLAIRANLERLMGHRAQALHVADIGCGAGARCRVWAEGGHHVHGADVNKALIALARKRAAAAALAIDYEVACATRLPWPELSMDVCLLPDLLQHVADWRSCLAEAVRVLKPGGVLYVSTSNMLCPVQHEFDLPFYSWYPGFLKRHFEDLASTTRPELAAYATEPAVNWFTWYGLRRHLASRGLACMDRFDMADAATLGPGARLLIALVRAVPLVRFCAHVATPYTLLLAFKPDA